MNNDIYNSMFHKGCWLYGADPDLSMYYFSLLDPAFYPPCVKIRDEHLLHEAVKRFYHKLHLYSVGKNFNGWVPDDHKELSRCLMDILNIVRNDVSFTHHLRTAICPRREAQPLLTDEDIPVNDRPTRFRMLLIAKMIVFSGLTPQLAAQKFGVNPTNAFIWANILLTHGPESFFKKEWTFTPTLEKAIAYVHRQNHDTPEHTCIRTAIFNHTRLKRILKRHPT